MPELSRFQGMIIYMLFRDNKEHNKPHVHVYYGEYKAAIGIDGELLAGKLPARQLKMLTGWRANLLADKSEIEPKQSELEGVEIKC